MFTLALVNELCNNCTTPDNQPELGQLREYCAVSVVLAVSNHVHLTVAVEIHNKQIRQNTNDYRWYTRATVLLN